MSTEERVREFVAMVEDGRSLDAIERFYADDVIVFENHERARVGKKAAYAFEKEALAASSASTARALGVAVDTRSGRSFVQWTIRFLGAEDEPMRLDEVAVQSWANGKIVEERFYYEGFVDESDPDTQEMDEPPT